MSAKHPIGILVEFLNSRYNTEEFRYYDYNLKYTEGQKGYIISVSDEPILDSNTNSYEYLYVVQVGLGNVINVPESDLINPNATLQEKVEQRLRKKQENKEFKDTEGRIGGSKKEKRAYKIVSIEDLKNIEQDEATAIELIKKDRVFPKINVNLEIENGVSSGAAFLKVKLREYFPSAPINNNRRDAYVGFANYFISKFQDINSYDQFISFVEYFKKNVFYIILKELYVETYNIVIENKEISEPKLIELKERKSTLLDRLASAVINNDNEDDLREELANVHEDIKKYSIEYSEVELNFIEYLTGSKSLYDINSKIIDSVLGRKFYKFLNKYDPFNKVFELALDYEQFSQIESEIAIDKESSYYLEQELRYSALLEQQSKLFTLDELKAFFMENSGYGYKGGDFSIRGYFYPRDIGNIIEAENYRNRYIISIKSQINSNLEKIEKIKNKYRVRDNNWEWFLGDKKTTKSSEPKTELVINSLPPLSFIKRVGGYAILDSDINPQSIKEKFGFKEVEFGQSLKDEDAREHVKHFLGGMSDLGDILDLDIIKLNKIGGLSIAFASRGSGKAMAHYESLRKIINITKLKGGGALAHEYLHYIDNIIPKINRKDYNYKEFASIQKSSRYSFSTRDVDNDNVSNAITNIFNYINNKKMPFGYDKSSSEQSYVYKTIYKSTKSYQIPKPYENETIDDYLNRFFGFYSQYQWFDRLNSKTEAILGDIVNRFGLDKHVFKLKTNKSMFYSNSSAMKSKYWVKEWELFARGFETYIFDKLEKAGRSNNYLVSGGYFDREEGVYPFGDERADLFVLYDNFIETIKKEYDLSGFKTWTNERVDEYITIDENGDEGSGIVVDDESGKMIEKIGEYTPIQMKLIKLAEMIENKSVNNKKKK